MLFTAVTAVLILLAIFNVTGSDETQKLIVKLAGACSVVSAAAIVMFGLSNLGKS